jgi:hypothetical protein
VKLVASNGTVNDSILKTDFIEVIATPASPATPSGPISVCGGQTQQYTTSAVLNANTYTWAVTPATAGNLTGNGITATFLASTAYTGNYTVKVNASGVCGTSAWSAELSCELYHSPNIFMIQGDGYYCQGTSGASITLNGSETGINYQLNIDNQPAGAAVPGTGSAIVWNDLTAEGFYTVVATTTACTQQMAGQIYVSMITPPVQPDMPVGNTNVCNTSTQIYSTPNVPLANTYAWVLTPSDAGTLTPNGNQVSITWSSSYTGTADLTVTATNDCGTSQSSLPLSIAVNSTPEPSVSGPATVCQNWDADYETATNAGSSYVWTVSGGTIVSGAGTPSVKVNWNISGTGTLQVEEITAQNCSGESAVFNVAVDPCVGLDENPANELLAVYPNPAQSQISIKLNEKAGPNSQLTFIDATGRIVAGFTLNNGVKLVEAIDISNLKSGFYTLLYITDGKVVSQTKVVKN